MTEYLMFQQAFLASLDNAQAAYHKANEMDSLNDGEDFTFEQLCEIVNSYVVASEPHEHLNLENLPMRQFVENLLELAYDRALPVPENMLGENHENPVKDFAKKTFLIIIAASILARI